MRYTILFSFIFSFGCTTRHSNYTIIKIPKNNSSLRLDGFYYQQISKNLSDGIKVTFLFNNGTLFKISQIFHNIDSVVPFYQNVDSMKYYSSKKLSYTKSYWGVFRNINDSIFIEKPDRYWGFPVFTLKGKIINDSTFYINSSQEERKEKFYYKTPDYYHFHKTDYKPDSTNKFVK